MKENFIVYSPFIISIILSVLILTVNVSHVFTLIGNSVAIKEITKPIKNEVQISTLFLNVETFSDNVKRRVDDRYKSMTAIGDRHYEHMLVEHLVDFTENYSYIHKTSRMDKDAITNFRSNYKKKVKKSIDSFKSLYTEIYGEIKRNIEHVKNLLNGQISQILNKVTEYDNNVSVHEELNNKFANLQRNAKNMNLLFTKLSTPEQIPLINLLHLI